MQGFLGSESELDAALFCKPLKRPGKIVVCHATTVPHVTSNFFRKAKRKKSILIETANETIPNHKYLAITLRGIVDRA